jgi:drug/metabolite transporter (DMT)-like permease
MQLSKRTIGIACAIITVLIWSSFIIIARAMAHKTLTPLDIAFVRMIGAAVVMLPWGWWWVRRMRASGDTGATWLGLSPYPWQLTAKIGVLAAVLYATLAYSGFLYAPAAHASVLMPGMLPLWTTLIALVVIGTRVSGKRWLGLGLIIAGGLLVGGASLLRAFDGGDVWKGDLLFLAASFSWSSYTVMARKHGLAAIPATIAVSHLREAPWSEIVFQALVQGIGSVVISGITFVRMVETFGPIRSTMITAVVPSLSALGAVLFLGEPLYWNLLLGLALVTVGIVFGVKPVLPAASMQATAR